MSSPQEMSSRARVAWGVLFAVLTIEAFGGIAVLVPITSAFLGAGTDPIGQRISIFLAALLAWAWVLVTLWGAVRSRASWARGSALTMHVLMFAAGTGILQLGGVVGDPLLGWGLIVLALVGFFAALVARPVAPEGEGNDPSPGADASA